jgi:hypothetical protein
MRAPQRLAHRRPESARLPVGRLRNNIFKNRHGELHDAAETRGISDGVTLRSNRDWQCNHPGLRSSSGAAERGDNWKRPEAMFSEQVEFVRRGLETLFSSVAVVRRFLDSTPSLGEIASARREKQPGCPRASPEWGRGVLSRRIVILPSAVMRVESLHIEAGTAQLNRTHSDFSLSPLRLLSGRK